MIEFVKELSGYSGCHILLFQDDEKRFVRKMSGTEAYNKRLKQQIEKQASFEHHTLKAPKIYKTGFQDGLYYADMEYIQGDTVAKLLLNGKLDEVQHALSDVFTLFEPAGETVCNPPEVIAKLESLTKSLSQFESHEPCQETLQKLMTYSWELHPAKCHGDLTLENMLVKNGVVYLIDFLDSFYDCMEVDMAKLMQDLSCKWSFRHTPLNGVESYACSRKADKLLSTYEALTQSKAEQIYAMLAMTLLRIYPYLKDQETKEFLDRQLMFLNLNH